MCRYESGYTLMIGMTAKVIELFLIDFFYNNTFFTANRRKL